MSGPRAGDALVEAGPRLGHQLEHGAIELHGPRTPRGAEHEPGEREASGSSAGRARRRATSRSSAGASGSSAPPPRSAGTGACRGRPPSPPRGPPGAPPSGRASEARVRESRARRARGPPAPGGCGAPRSGSCRPRAWLPAYGGLRADQPSINHEMRNGRLRLSLLGQFQPALAAADRRPRRRAGRGAGGPDRGRRALAKREQIAHGGHGAVGVAPQLVARDLQRPMSALAWLCSSSTPEG